MHDHSGFNNLHILKYSSFHICARLPIKHCFCIQALTCELEEALSISTTANRVYFAKVTGNDSKWQEMWRGLEIIGQLEEALTRCAGEKFVEDLFVFSRFYWSRMSDLELPCDYYWSGEIPVFLVSLH